MFTIRCLEQIVAEERLSILVIIWREMVFYSLKIEKCNLPKNKKRLTAYWPIFFISFIDFEDN